MSMMKMRRPQRVCFCNTIGGDVNSFSEENTKTPKPVKDKEPLAEPGSHKCQ